MKLKIPTPSQAIALGSKLLMDREWFRYLRDLGRLLETHTHDGSDSATLDHESLANIGENSHPEIDARLTGLDNDVDDIVETLAEHLEKIDEWIGWDGPVWHDDITIEGSATVTNGMVLPKTPGMGIKVDPASPTYGWKDQLGEITVRSPGVLTDPTLATYIGGIPQYQFSVNDSVLINYHLGHDLLPMSDVHLHFHWAHNSAAVSSGSVTWAAEVTYSKGHDQEADSTPITITVTQAASTIQYRHLIAEVQLSSLLPTASQLDSSRLEPDGIISIRAYLSANSIATTPPGPTIKPFLRYVDLHYQTTGVLGTKQKAPNFYL